MASIAISAITRTFWWTLKENFWKQPSSQPTFLFYCAEHAICHRRREQDTHFCWKETATHSKKSLKRVDDKKSPYSLRFWTEAAGTGDWNIFYLLPFIRKDFAFFIVVTFDINSIIDTDGWLGTHQTQGKRASTENILSENISIIQPISNSIQTRFKYFMCVPTALLIAFSVFSFWKLYEWMKAISFSYSNQVLFRISICKSHRDSNNIPAGLEAFYYNWRKQFQTRIWAPFIRMRLNENADPTISLQHF